MANEKKGLGDDQGTRVGRPDDPEPRSLGAGAEGALGIHAAQENKGQQASTGRPGDPERAGSEPLEGRTQEHRSGYGGAGGRPVTSSDTREAHGTEHGAKAHGDPMRSGGEGSRHAGLGENGEGPNQQRARKAAEGESEGQPS